MSRPIQITALCLALHACGTRVGQWTNDSKSMAEFDKDFRHCESWFNDAQETCMWDRGWYIKPAAAPNRPQQ